MEEKGCVLCVGVWAGGMPIWDGRTSIQEGNEEISACCTRIKHIDPSRRLGSAKREQSDWPCVQLGTSPITSASEVSAKDSFSSSPLMAKPLYTSSIANPLLLPESLHRLYLSLAKKISNRLPFLFTAQHMHQPFHIPTNVR